MTINFLFTSDVLCLIKFNGAVLGNCHKTPLEYCSFNFETAVVEILPFNENKIFCNQAFLLKNEGTLSCSSPLLRITKYFIDNYGIHFTPEELPSKTLKTVYQQNYALNNLHHSIKILYNGSYSLNISCGQYLETFPLPDLTDITVSIINIPDACFLLKGFKNTETYIKIIAFHNGYYVPYDGYVKNIKAEDKKLFITKSFNDHMGHCLERVCILENQTLKIIEENKSYNKNKKIENFLKEIIPYVFIESIKNSFFEEEKEFLLTLDLQKADINYFKNYFGEFTDVFQNPITNRLCIIKKIDNYFQAIDYDFEFEDEKISNITTE